MRAVSIEADHAIQTVECPYPTTQDDEIIVAPMAGGICGIDLHIVKGEFPQAVFPVVPLHEFAGRVAAVGRSVPRAISSRRIRRCPAANAAGAGWAGRISAQILPSSA
jgi:D-arabinose 1-dehydrogenase-like Zn-dependent alcohol dehydrogenase